MSSRNQKLSPRNKGKRETKVETSTHCGRINKDVNRFDKEIQQDIAIRHPSMTCAKTCTVIYFLKPKKNRDQVGRDEIVDGREEMVVTRRRGKKAKVEPKGTPETPATIHSISARGG